MTNEHFQVQVKRYWRGAGVIGVSWLIAPFVGWVVCRLVFPHVSEVLMGWLIVILIGCWAVVPIYLYSRLARNLGLFCSHCGLRDDASAFVRRVQRDGRCPRCKMEFPTAA